MATMNLKNEEGASRSIAAFRVVGYGLLIMSLFDLISILVRVKSLDANVLFQTAGSIIERTPVPVLGFLLIFFGDRQLRQSWERIVTQALCWLSLFYGIGLWLLIPLIFSVTLQLNLQINSTIATQANPQLQQLQKTENDIQQAKPNDLKRLVDGWNQQQNRSVIQTPQGFKEQVLKEINQSRQTIRNQMQITESNQRLELITNAVKWVIAAFISGFLLIYLWQLNRQIFC